jgi:hypothetical protein
LTKTKDFENFYAAAALLRIGQERSKMSARVLDFDDMGKSARVDERGMGSGKGKGEGLWWHVGALAAAVRSALVRPRTQRRPATRQPRPRNTE